MELVELLTTSRLSLRDYFVSVLNFFIGVIMLSIALTFQTQENLHFRCEYAKQNASDQSKDYFQKLCFHHYDKRFNLPFTLYMSVIVNFFIPTVLTTFYSYFMVKTHVDRVEEACKFDEEDPRRTETIKTKRIFIWYLVQLSIRCVLRIVFVVLFYAVDSFPKNFPTEFSCQLNSFDVNCVNSMGPTKSNLAFIVSIVNCVFLTYLFVEIVCLLGGVCNNSDFRYDSEFCRKYLLMKHKRPLLFKEESNKEIIKDQIQFLEPLLPINRDNKVNKLSDDTDVHVVDIHSKKNGTTGVRFRVNDLFSGDWRTILIMGDNGMGKSNICTKVLRHWCSGHSKSIQEFQHIFLFRLRNFNSKSMEKISFREFLGTAEHSIGRLNDDILQYILDNSKKVLFIFDGLDEFKDLDKCIKCESDYAGFNGVNDKIPVSALFVKLLQSRLLRGATIIVTTVRPSAIDSADWLLIKFDKVLEIIGFQAKAVEHYAKHFYRKQCTKPSDKTRGDDTKTFEEIWKLIQSNSTILLKLCKIPVICLVICKWFFSFKGVENIPSPSWDSRLTGLFKEILRTFILRHHPDFKTDSRGPDFKYTLEDLCSKTEIDRVGIFAKKKLEGENRREVFGQQEVNDYGLKKKHFGLVVCLPKLHDVLPYGYIDQPQYRFAFPYLQEFLAARCIVSEAHKDRLEDDIRSKAEDEKWHVVLQFVAGLISDMKCKSDEWKEIYDKLIGTFNSIFERCNSRLGESSRKKALCVMKCIHELNVEEDETRAALQLSEKQIDFSNLGVSPADCFVMADFLHRLQVPLKLLNLESNDTILESGLSELARLVGTERSPRTLNISNCNVTDEGLKILMEATCKNGSTLDSLLISGNTRISKNAIEAVCKALKDDKCQIKKLDLYGIRLCRDGAQYICEALQDSKCRLSELYVNLDVLFEQHAATVAATGHGPDTAPGPGSATGHGPDTATGHGPDTAPGCASSCLRVWHRLFDHQRDSGSRPLDQQLLSFSKLNVLGLNGNGITDDSIGLVCEIIKNENCKVKDLYLDKNLITDRGLNKLIKSLTNRVDSTLEVLSLEWNRIDGNVDLPDEFPRLNKLNLLHNVISNDIKTRLLEAKPASLTLKM